MMRLCAAITFIVVLLFAAPAPAASTCDPDRVQDSGSIYRICMPDPADYNGMLVIWAHGFQDAGTPVGIPEDQLCLGTFCIPEIVNALGFGFATNSYSKTGMAILQGKDDILDLVGLYAAQKGTPQKVYLVGASEGGIITALSLEQYPERVLRRPRGLRAGRQLPAADQLLRRCARDVRVFLPRIDPRRPVQSRSGAGRDLERLLRAGREADRARSGQPGSAESVGGGGAPARSTPTTTSRRSRCRCRTSCDTAS